jgi:Na+/melibiose symporter-like transporter
VGLRGPICWRVASPWRCSSRRRRHRPAASGYVAGVFLATATAFAFFQVPYVAIPAERAGDYQELTRLMTWRVAVLALAIPVSGAIAPIVVTAWPAP